MSAFLKAGSADPPRAKRRILIVDDHNFFAACLRTLLNNESDLTVCGVLANARDLRERIAELKPNLVVIDLSLGDENGLEIGEGLRAMEVMTPILFVSSMRSPTAAELAAVSRSAFVGKSRTPSQFLSALRASLEAQSSLPAPSTLSAARGKA